MNTYKIEFGRLFFHTKAATPRQALYNATSCKAIPHVGWGWIKGQEALGELRITLHSKKERDASATSELQLSLF